ncbi:MAG: hypothetical protein AABX83_00660 [Nanoarchaeota archaeon]
MENTDTLEENVKDRKSHVAYITIFREDHIVTEAKGDRTLGLFQLPDRIECQLGTARQIMEYQFNTRDISRGTVYQGVSEEAFHKISKKISMAEDYGDAAQIANWEFLEEDRQYRYLGNYID